MSGHKHHEPPRWATRFLSWYCRPELLEDLQGDLNEYFDRHVQTKGLLRAKLIYITDVFKFLRSYTIRKPEFINLIIHWIMIGSYIKTSGRSIVRNKMFSFINIFGLAISMSVGLLLIAFLVDLTSYDKMHVKGDRIYRLIDTHYGDEGHAIELASTNVVMPRKIKESYAGIEDIVIIRNSFGNDAHYKDRIVPIGGIWADESFFNVFSFKLLKGNAVTALKEPFSIVMTETEAKKVFGDDEPLGKSIKLGGNEEKPGNDYMVTGVMADPPKFSHLQFGSIASFATVDILEKDNEDFLEWTSVWQNYAYIVMPENTSTQDLQHFIDEQAKAENAKLEHQRVEFFLQPMFSIAMGKELSNQLGNGMPAFVMWIVSALAFVVILSACFNYTNLSIARSLRRSKEVGIRKVIGAMRAHVLGQFIAEAVIISLLALMFSFVLFLMLRPAFLALAPQLSNIVSLQLSLKTVACFILLGLTVGLVAGILPAVFFSRIKAVQVLKDASSLKVFRNIAMRKVLIVAQYTLSLIFIATTLIAYKQYKHFIAFDLGFNTENIVNVRLQGNKADVLAKAFKEIPEVNNLSKSVMVTSIGSYYGARIKYKGDSLNIFYNNVDEQYLPIHGHKFLAGRNFTARVTKSSEQEVIVNEKLIKHFNMGDAQKALGEVLRIDTINFVIVGVLKDFHYGKVDSKIDPFILRYASDDDVRYINAAVTSKDWPATLERMEAVWKKIDPIHKFDAKFYDEEIEQAYSQFQVMIKIIGFLAILAISIASIGLLGMVVFTTETRTKEISIRKVLGASEGNLVYLLSRGFVMLLFISAAIALPATYLFFREIVLVEFEFHAPIGMIEMFSGLIAIFMIAMIMIGSQTIRVARSNPAHVLKSE